MSNQQPNQPQYSEDNALVEFIQGARKYGNEIRKNWKLVLAIIAVCVSLALLRKFLSKSTYQADLSFMVNEDEGSKLSGLSTALENIGFGFGATNSEYNLEKIMELMRSRRIIYASLLEKDSVDGSYDFFANHLIDAYKLQEVWKKKKPHLQDLRFTHDSLEVFTRKENTGLVQLYKMILGQSGDPALLSSEILDLPAIMTMTFTSRNEEFSYKFVNVLFENLSRFYIEKTTEKQRETYELVATETDSIRQVLVDVEYQLAAFEDQNQGLVTNRAQLQKDRLSRELTILETMYGEAVANEEVAKFALRKRTPFIQPIDIPVAPLKRIQESLSKALIKGLILGLILSVAFVIGRLIFREITSSLPPEPQD
jgi:hypothetical protein